MDGTLAPPDYLIIGHVTHDLLPGGTTAFGGTALYASLTAHRLGLRTAVFTSAAQLPTELNDLLVACEPTPVNTTLEHRYSGTQREQHVHAVAAPLTAERLPTDWLTAPIVHLGSILAECDLRLVERFPHALLGATPQGWMRSWHPPIPAPIVERVWQPAPALLARLNLLVFSIEDVGGDEALVASYANHCPIVVVTRGEHGATLYQANASRHIAAFPAHSIDANGAGDVFAAAMLVHLRETGDAVAAAMFAAATAALAVEGFAYHSIPSRAAVQARLLKNN